MKRTPGSLECIASERRNLYGTSVSGIQNIRGDFLGDEGRVILESPLAPSGLSVAFAHGHTLANLVESVAEPARSQRPLSARLQCCR